MPTDIPSVVEGVAELCRRFEGLRLRPYYCPAGVATIGYGATSYLDGKKVQLKDPAISVATAEDMLIQQIIRVYLPGVQRHCPGLPDEAQIATTDFAFNLGLNALGQSTLKRRLNSGDWRRAAEEINKWVYGGGKVLPGLVLRRQAEATLLLSLL